MSRSRIILRAVTVLATIVGTFAMVIMGAIAFTATSGPLLQMYYDIVVVGLHVLIAAAMVALLGSVSDWLLGRRNR